MSITRRPSPTPGLLAGLFITLAAVVVSGVYVTQQVSRLRTLQTDITDRHRRDSLQLLRIQNDLNSVGLAMRDMLDNDEGYPLTAWQAQFERIRTDLDDALRRQEAVALAQRTPEQREFLGSSLDQFWDASDRIFALARDGREGEAREQIRLSLQARQAALASAVARSWCRTTRPTRDRAARADDLHFRRPAAGVLLGRGGRDDHPAHQPVPDSIEPAALRGTGRALGCPARRRPEIDHDAGVDAGRDRARAHDDLGQVLTALGLMVGRALKRAPPGSPLEADLREIGGVAQAALDNVRGLSQTLHPSNPERRGARETIQWYLSTARRQGSPDVADERLGTPWPVAGSVAIHVYRVLQESLTNVARHSGSERAWVRLTFAPDSLSLEVEDRGRGFDAGGPRSRRRPRRRDHARAGVAHRRIDRVCRRR